jgi:hypothetical protein
MNCAQFQEILPEVIDGGRNAEQEAHLQSCAVCSGLVTDLNLIAGEARQLQELADPAPRVWNSLEIQLRREGLIRESQLGPTLLPAVRRRWSLAWLAPVAALGLLTFGVFVYERWAREPQPVAQVPAGVPVAVTNIQTGKSQKSANNNNNNNEDQQLLEAVGSRAPTMQAAYASNLQNVNAYIRDAEESAQADPNDEEAQQVVMDAYEQRATIYEMALDRSLP